MEASPAQGSSKGPQSSTQSNLPKITKGRKKQSFGDEVAKFGKSFVGENHDKLEQV
jgi:hypothetical protein